MRQVSSFRPASTRVIILAAALIIVVLYLIVMVTQQQQHHQQQPLPAQQEREGDQQHSAPHGAQSSPHRRNSGRNGNRVNEFDDHHHHHHDDVTAAPALPVPLHADSHHDAGSSATAVPSSSTTTASTATTAVITTTTATTTTTVAAATDGKATANRSDGGIFSFKMRTFSPEELRAREEANRVHRNGSLLQRPKGSLMKEEVVIGKIPNAWLAAQKDQQQLHMDDAALADKFGDLDIVYTWVNGSDMMHRWKKSQLMGRMVGEANSRDRDSDELRHSLRSIHEHMRWHRGRVTIVSPGHVPAWMDLTNPRVRVVHQDALIVDEQERFTFDTNTIEQNLWRLPLLSDVFVQFNDDYFVMRDCPPSVFLNEHGGPNLLYENGIVNGGLLQVRKWLRDGGKIWIASVFHTHAAMGTLLPRESRSFLRYIKHAPFTMCRPYLQALQQRVFPGAYHRAARTNRFRNHLDVLTPFVHHGFAFAAPDVMLGNRSLRRAQLHAMDRAHTAEMRSDVDRFFNPPHDYDYAADRDGDLPPCPPATWKSGDAADSRLVVLKDDNGYNKQIIDTTLKGNYQFIAINDGFNNAELVSPLIRDYVERWFPRKSGFESRHVAPHLPPAEEQKRVHVQPEALAIGERAKKQQQQKQKSASASDEHAQLLIRDDPSVLKPLHESLDTGDLGVILFASSCDGMCGAVRSAATLGFSRIRQRVDEVKAAAQRAKEALETTTTTTTTTTTEATTGTHGDADDDVGVNVTGSNHSANRTKSRNATAANAKRAKKPIALPPPPKDLPGLPTFFVVPAYHPHYHHKLGGPSATATAGSGSGAEDEDWNARLIASLQRCKCPIGSYQHVDAEEVAVVPRIFVMRNDTVHVDAEHGPVRARMTRVATGRHEERHDVRLVVDDPEVLTAVVARARKDGRMPAASLSVMVLTTVDAVFGETVTAGHVTTALASDHRAAVIHFTPLPSSVAPQHRAPAGDAPMSGGSGLSKSHVLLMPDHFTLSYLRTYPIPTTRAFEVPDAKFLRFFLMSYRTQSLGLNPEFVRKQREKELQQEQEQEQQKGGSAHQQQRQMHEEHPLGSNKETHENGEAVLPRQVMLIQTGIHELQQRALARRQQQRQQQPTTTGAPLPPATTTAGHHSAHEGDA
jgi:hypothetical protein